jgi:hypothetical protein
MESPQGYYGIRDIPLLIFKGISLKIKWGDWIAKYTP